MPVYLNNAATSWPKAPGLGATMAACMEDLPYHAGRAGFSSPDISGKCRALVAGLLDIKDAKRIIFCPHATHALNIALHGMQWHFGASVVNFFVI
jgi:selenocysteine lyase/cysteine desulfurase